MPDDQLKSARDFLRNQLGESFEAKATDAFVKRYFMFGMRDGMVMAESSSEASSHSIILEIDDEDVTQVRAEADPRLEDRGMNEVIATMPDISKHGKAALNQLVKSSKIKRYKEKSLMKVQSITSFLEKKIEESFSRKTKSILDQPYITQYCWLNQTMKTLTDPLAIAEAIQDRLITSVDVPRRLISEITQTVPGMFASQFTKKFSSSGRNISVAIIDSEIDHEHDALKGRVVRRENYTTEPWGNPDKHGTAIAGIIGSNHEIYSGLATEVMLYNYKVLVKSGTSGVNADDFGGAKAIEKAVEDGIQIANCSWGISKVSATLSREAKACNAAWELGLTIVKSAGNQGSGSGTLTTPAEADGIIVVGASNKNLDSIENYSSRGPIPSGSLRPHMLAPGGSSLDNILSCRISGDFGPVGHGTSYAAPHVSGLIALILEENPELSNDELRDFAIKLCTALENINQDDQGNGVISLQSLVV